MVFEPADPSRRAAFAAAGLLAAGAVLSLPGCAKPAADAGKKGAADVSATEDLMREHGVLRRLLVIYRETAGVIRAAAATLDLAALGQAADLFRRFGENYHEKALEEAHIFPMVKKAGGAGSSLIDTLIAQHRRGREINDYVTGLATSGRLGTGQAEPLAAALESFARMYEIHAAMEDTVVFQAWRDSLNAKELDAWSDKFEDIEHQTFKGDGFDLALDQVAGIEQRLGLSDLARYTAPAPPAA